MGSRPLIPLVGVVVCLLTPSLCAQAPRAPSGVIRACANGGQANSA